MYTTIKSMKSDDKVQLQTYDNILQVTIYNDTYVFDLDEQTEVKAIEDVDNLMGSSKFLNIGLNLMYSHQDEEMDNENVERARIIMNPHGSLAFGMKEVWCQVQDPLLT